MPTPSVRVCSRRVRMPSVRDMHPRARQRVGGAAARSGIARTHETGQPTRAFTWPTRCPQGVIVGSSKIGDTKRAHRKVWHLIRLPGVPSSFHDVLRERQRVVYTCRDEPGLDTHTHAPALRLQHKRGAVVLNGVHRRWHPLGTSPTHRRDAKAVRSLSSSALRTTMRRREACCHCWRMSKSERNASS